MQVINLDLPKKSLKKSFQLMTKKFELCLEIPLKAFHCKDYISKNYKLATEKGIYWSRNCLML